MSSMKVVSINLQVPKAVDDFYRDEARVRVVSKSSIIREVLIKHVAAAKESRKQDGQNTAAALAA